MIEVFSLCCAILQAIHGPKMEYIFETIIASTSLEVYRGHRYFVIQFSNGWLQWHLHCNGMFQSLIVSPFMPLFVIACQILQVQ